jgi:hypothetical protein
MKRLKWTQRVPCPVAAGILPAVKLGFQPGGKTVCELITARNFSARPGGRMPPSTAGRMPAATCL